MVTVDEREKYKSGALIAIDEIDEAGRIVRTSTVREKFVELPSTGESFVDIGTPCSSLSATVDDHNISNCNKLMDDSNRSLKMATASENSVAPGHYVMKKRKTHCKILSDLDTSRNVFSHTSEY